MGWRPPWLAVCMILGAATAMGQNIELTGFVGRQANGGLDLSTAIFQRMDVQNGRTSGLAAGYLRGDHYGVEFMWSYNKADTVGEPRGGGSGVKIFTLDTNQYIGNFVAHFTRREKSVRPFVFMGLGVTNLHPARAGLNGITRLVGDLGGGVKYNFSRHLGLRLQAKWSPAYVASTRTGYWCDPALGGCWTVGDNHYLNEFDANVGVTLRF
jgi:outer membrane protein W